MLGKTANALRRWEQRISRSWGNDISTPGGRRAATLHGHLTDLAFLRALWPNMHEVSGGVWRSNQPVRSRFDRIETLGIRTVLNLRGQPTWSTVLFEAEQCERRGITLIHHELNSHRLDTAEKYLGLLDHFARVRQPLLIHCKSGADRTGLAAAFYLIDREGAAPDTARAQLSRRFGHFRNGPTGILDHLLDTYLEAARDSGISLRQWLATRYDREALSASYRR